jgi:hypothetical protein
VNVDPQALASFSASLFRRAFAMVSADVLDRVRGAWLFTRTPEAEAGSR